MSIKLAISWGWASEWLKDNLANYIADYADDPQELKEIAGELIETEVLSIYNQSNYPEKKSILLAFKELYEALNTMTETDWNELLNYIYPDMSSMMEETFTYERPSFQQIMQSIEPKKQMSMEDIETQPIEQFEPEITRPIENIMIKHPKTKKSFPAGLGKKVYNSTRRDTGTIDSIRENYVTVKDESTGQLTEWPLTDQIWESI